MGLAAAVVAAVAWVASGRVDDRVAERPRGGELRPVPVEVAAIERGAIEHRRTFTGSLAPKAEFVVAPKVGGRIEALAVDLADTVARGEPVAKLDDDEFAQAVLQAEADFAVAEANLAEARSLLAIAERELRRLEELHQRGVASASELDLAKAEQLARQARVAVAEAQLRRSQAALETARIRLGYTEVKADWRGGGERRVVAERYVDEGQTVAANEPLLRIVEMDPITAVFFVTERDYALLSPGQTVTLATDAHPGKAFTGRIERIAPVFRESTRQARVEAGADNPGLELKPGMFVRATAVLGRAQDATIVPEQALVRRDGRDGVFVIAGDGRSVAWREVGVGFRDRGRVQVSGPDLDGEVVTLGQHLLDHGSAVSISEQL